MTITEPALLGAADLPAMLKLSAEAGWNQTAEDWAVFVRHGQVFGSHAGGVLVATAAALPYGEFGFVSMVLTARPARGQGFATRLTARAIEALRPAVPVLDATEAGEPVYARLGFRPLFGIARWHSSRADGGGGGWGAAGSAAGDDAGAFGADRSFVLADFARRPGTHGMVRAGRLSAHAGPLVAAGEDAAIAALAAAGLPHPMVIDVPSRWTRIAAWLAARGFAVQRRFTRMALGGTAPFGDPARVFATAGPEFG